MKLTTFSSDFTSTKVPHSPYGDKTFDFTENEVTIEEALNIMRNEFILNRNYHIPKVTRLRRSKKDLSPFLLEHLEFVIVDIDKVHTKASEKIIVKYFRDNDYSVGIIPSRGHNNIDNFNLKVLLKASGYNNKASLRGVLEEINETLFHFCKIDLTSINEGSYQAPSFSKDTILLQEGSYIPHFELKDEVKEHLEIELTDDHSEVLDICIDEYRIRGFKMVAVVEERGLLTFSHPSEVTKNGYFVFINNPFYMNHFNKSKGFNIFNAVKGRKAVQEYFDQIKTKERENDFLGTGSFKYLRNINSRYIKVGEAETIIIDKWLDSEGLFKLKSAMGTGKSTVIEHVIKKSQERKLRVLLITNRVSVAKDFKSKYDIKMYSDGDYEIGDDLIVQFDSLRHYSLQQFDVVILDEFVSIMLHSRNGMNEFSNLNRVKLMYAMRTKTCMIADAFLFGVEDKLIPTKPKYGIINSYREDLNMFEYDDIPTIIHKIREVSLSERGEKRKVSVSCSTRALAKAIELVIAQAGLKTMLLSADSLDEEKELIYKEFEKEGHDGWDVLIYTPTLTVGVSILNISHHHFHIDESNTVDVISSIQMIRRSRKTENIHYLVKQRRRLLETDAETLNWEVRNNIDKYYKNNNSLLIGINDYGDFVLSPVGEFINAVEVLYNKLENNHKHSFELLLSHQISSKPAKVPKKKTDIDINSVKKHMKLEEIQKMKETLCKLEEVDYSDMSLDEFDKRNYLVSDKDKMLKLMSEIRNNLVEGADTETIKVITRMEITQNFKFMNRLKKLKYFLTKNEQEVGDLLSYMISEDLIDKGQIQYFRYVQALKKSKISLKSPITQVEIRQVNEKIGWGDFRAFLIKIGYIKKNNKHILGQTFIDFAKLLR